MRLQINVGIKKFTVSCFPERTLKTNQVGELPNPKYHVWLRQPQYWWSRMLRLCRGLRRHAESHRRPSE